MSFTCLEGVEAFTERPRAGARRRTKALIGAADWVVARTGCKFCSLEIYSRSLHIWWSRSGERPLMILSINTLAGVSQQSPRIPTGAVTPPGWRQTPQAAPARPPYSAAYGEGTVSVKPAAYAASIALEEDGGGNRTNELMRRPPLQSIWANEAHWLNTRIAEMRLQ